MRTADLGRMSLAIGVLHGIACALQSGDRMSNHPFRRTIALFGAVLFLTVGVADAKTTLRKSTYSRPTVASHPPIAETELPPPSRPTSAGDLAQSRAASGASLRAYRSDQEYRAQFRQPSGSVPASGRFAQVPRESYGAWNDRRTSFYGGQGWSPPTYIYNSRPSFGMWDGMWMWFMLDSMANASHAAFFYNHNTDPGYLEWRGEADRLAAENADLKAKLAALDADMAARNGQPRDTNYLPDDASPQVALASNNVVGEPPSSHFPWLMVIVLVIAAGGGYLAYQAWLRRVPAGPGSGETMNFATYAQNRLSGKGYTPTLFRVGMTVGFDESPFILGDGHLAASKPFAIGGHLAARAVGALGTGATAFRRVYVEGGFFQFHLDAAGNPDECRWFSPLDEFTPAGAADPNDGNSWAFWLDNGVGQIGWPAFETPDGKRYERVWPPGDTRVEPLTFTEQLNEGHGNRARQHGMMLYRRATGLRAPAPEDEYALLDAVEDGQAAYVAIHAGIDVNPASLALS